MGEAMERDWYKVLGIRSDATQSEIKRAYRKLALRHHPDRNPGDPHAQETFKEINAAYQVLRDPASRERYDWRELQTATITVSFWAAIFR